MITLYAEGRSTTIKGTMKILVLSSLPKVIGRVAMPIGVIASSVFILGFEGDPRITPGSGPLLDFCTGISFPCRGAITTLSRAAYNDVYLPLHRAFRVEGWLVWLPYISIEVATTYEVLDLILQIIAFLSVVSVVTVEATIMSAVPVLGLRLHRVGGFEESFLSNLEENLSPGRVERNVGWSRNDLLGSLCPLPWEPKRWAPRGLIPQALLILMLLRYQSLSVDILVGPLQHF
ncbi:hypothetical protein BHM03_00009764 [Ensete ventricosum]|nr:hypothetical protein BHM03_00009764 [Ensete ventricosum]